MITRVTILGVGGIHVAAERPTNDALSVVVVVWFHAQLAMCIVECACTRLVAGGDSCNM